MTRPINFRAWLTKEKKMYDDTFAVTESGQMIVVEQAHVAVSPDYIFLDSDEYKLLQYTGLKDKNGKEIYEGDIAEHEDGEYSFVAKVVYNDWLFYLEGINPIDNYSFEDITDNCVVDAKVIGNIYQHPHLLEGVTNGSS